MKLKTIAGALMLVALCGALAQAQEAYQVRANVPFEFHAAGRTFAAGDYVVAPSDNRAFLRLREVATGKTIPLLVNVNENREGTVGLEFDKVDGQAYLKSVSTGSVAYDFAIPHASRQLARMQGAGSTGQ